MSFTPLPEDFGKGGAHLSEGGSKLKDILTEHIAGLTDHETRVAAIEAVEPNFGIDPTARTAAAAAQTTANNAATAAATASTAAATAATAAAAANTAAVAAEADGEAALTAAAAAAADAAVVATDLAALTGALTPLFFDEKWRARFREISPVNPMFQFWTLDLQGGSENADDSQWRMRNGATRNANGVPSSVHCAGAGQDVTKAGTQAVKDHRSASWYLAGAGYFQGAINGGADHRAFTLGNGGQTQWISAGVHAGETTHFSFWLKGGSGPGATGDLLVPSTIVFSEYPDVHTFEMRFKHTGPGAPILQGSVDGEPWVTITTNPYDLPAGAFAQDHGVFDGTGIMYVTLAAVGTEL